MRDSFGKSFSTAVVVSSVVERWRERTVAKISHPLAISITAYVSRSIRSHLHPSTPHANKPRSFKTPLSRSGRQKQTNAASKQAPISSHRRTPLPTRQGVQYNRAISHSHPSDAPKASERSSPVNTQKDEALSDLISPRRAKQERNRFSGMASEASYQPAGNLKQETRTNKSKIRRRRQEIYLAFPVCGAGLWEIDAAGAIHRGPCGLVCLGLFCVRTVTAE